MNTIELKLFIHSNDTCFQVEYSPDTGIDEVWASLHGEPAVIDTQGLFVATGTFPDIKTVPLLEELHRLADMAFSEHREEWKEMRREAAAEYRREAYD